MVPAPEAQPSPSDPGAAALTDSQLAILEAAAHEFADRGYDGTRIEHVARRAGYNKALIYRHFTDKDGLFRATLRHRFTHREQLLQQVPATCGDVLQYWTQQQRDDPTFMRLIQWEALNDDGGEPVEAERRRVHYARQVAMGRALQAAGLVDQALDPEMMFVALLSIVVFPDTFPQIIRLATGLDPSDPEWDERWGVFLHQFADKLR